MHEMDNKRTEIGMRLQLSSTEALEKEEKKRKQLKISMELKIFQMPMLRNFCSQPVPYDQ